MSLDSTGTCFTHKVYACWHCRTKAYWAAKGQDIDPSKTIDMNTGRPVGPVSPESKS